MAFFLHYMEIINSQRQASLNYRIEKEEYLKNKKKKPISFIQKIKYKLLSSKFLYYFFQNKPQNLVLNESIFYFNNLPKNFDNYKILFISDLHLDIKPNSLDYIIKMNLPNPDLLILGGDYFDKPLYKKQDIIDLQKFISLFNAKHKFAVLGNYDSYNILDIEEYTDLNFLLNESVILEKNNEKIILTGFDDYTYFESQFQNQAILKNNDLFKIAITHNRFQNT